jgi:hypothetical protein
MLSVVSLCLACLGVSAAPEDSAILNSRDFTIPIRIDAERRQDVRELKLYCSRDLGRTWELVAAAPPEREAFPYRAPADGTYWFTVQVIDRTGKPSPTSPFDVPPGLKVRVDTEERKITDKDSAELSTLRAEVLRLKIQVEKLTEEKNQLADRVQKARDLLKDEDKPQDEKKKQPF